MGRHYRLILIATLVLLLTGFLYVRQKRKQAIAEGSSQKTQAATINTNGTRLVKNYREVLGTQLPPFELANASGEKLTENLVREGNVVLFFLAADCRACMENGEFFKSAVSMRSDIRYFGVRPYDQKTEPEETYKTVPFAVYFDVNHNLSRYLGIRGVPVAVLLKDGSIKRIWGGIATEQKDKVEFDSWLSAL